MLLLRVSSILSWPWFHGTPVTFYAAGDGKKSNTIPLTV